ncbi:MAG: GNAT family N-acetyltransferase [Anaerolineae bacterium]|nr:GNAT family N-acetyltransferase [Anaerolineae bacterium]
MPLIETQRLSMRQLVEGDAPFILELLNEPAYIKNIGDRGVRNLDDARRYIVDGPTAMHERYGFGLLAVELKESGVPIGMCGLIKRDSLDDVDLGYGILERYWNKGYASEAAAAVIDYGHTVVGLKRIVAITAQDNQGSINVLTKLGFRFEKLITFPGETEEINLFAL